VTKTLTFLHTLPIHIATFDRLVAEIDPAIPVRHVVDESLLQEARAAGAITPELERRIGARVRQAAEAEDAAVVLCTCSTIGGSAEQSGGQLDQPVLRVDRPMAERAVATGSRIVVAAALASTLEPTSELIRDAAHQIGKAVQISEVLCDSAWPKFEQGDQAGYAREIAACLHESPLEGDVIVLAQASMAPAAELCADLGVPILSSPRIGVEAAVAAYRAAEKA
jgi:hypothetical protein